MSVATRRAIYGKLAGDSTLNGLLGAPVAGYTKALYYEVAPENPHFPYVIFQKQSGTPTYSLASDAFDSEVWTVKGVDHSTTADAVDAVATRINALLTDGTLSISGKTQLYLRRDSDLDYAEVTDGEIYRHSGAMYRLVYQ